MLNLEVGQLRVTHPCATRPEDLVRLACLKHAASVHPEPGSNSPCDGSITRLHADVKLIKFAFASFRNGFESVDSFRFRKSVSVPENLDLLRAVKPSALAQVWSLSGEKPLVLPCQATLLSHSLALSCFPPRLRLRKDTALSVICQP